MVKVEEALLIKKEVSPGILSRPQQSTNILIENVQNQINFK
jgi:hypothetical protein